MVTEVRADVKKWVDDHIDWYEKSILWFATFDRELFGALNKVVCRSSSGDSCNDFATPMYNSYFTLVRDHRLAEKGCPIVDDAVAKVIIDNAPVMMMSQLEKNVFIALHDELSRQSLEKTRGMVSAGLGYWLTKRRTSTAMIQRSAYRDWDANELVGSIGAELNFINSAMDPTGHVTEFAVLALTMKPVVADCIPTGLVHYDRQLGGGLHRKDGHLVIAAPGVGKTVFALQIAVRAALDGFVVAFITTEQPPEELVPRIVSNFCRIEFSRISRGFSLAGLPPNDQPKVMKFAAKIANRLFFFDWGKVRKSAAAGGLEEERATCIEKTGRCDLMVLDWIGGAITDEARADKDKKRLAMQMTADGMAQLARDYDMATLAMAQAHKTTGTNNGSVSVSDCTDNKTLDQKMTVVTGITGLFKKEAAEAIKGGGDPSSLGLFEDKQYLFTSKARKSSGGHAPFRRSFNQQRLEDFD